MGESISTIQRSPRINTSYKVAAPQSLSAAADGLADGSGERRTSPVNGIERSLSLDVVPKTKSLPVSATTFPTALSLYIAQGRLRKDIRPLSKLFSKAALLPFEKEININLVYSSCLKHANEMLLGDPRQADQRTQSFPFPIVIHQPLDPAARALKRQAPCLYCTCEFTLEHSTGSERVDAWGRRAVELIICMITRDFSVISIDVTGVSLSLSLSLSTSTTHKSHWRTI